MSRGPARPARPWLAFALSSAALFLSAWIYLPAPTYFWLTFGVAAPEVSPWIVFGAAAAAAVAATDFSTSPLARLSCVMGVVAFLLSAVPLVRLPPVIQSFDRETRAVSAEPAQPSRAHQVVLLDLFRGVPVAQGRVTRGIVVATPRPATLTMSVYQPAARGRYPIVVQIYGGAWQRGSPSDNANFAAWVASQGWVVFAIDYRHAPAAHWRAILADVDTALAWVKRHASSYDADPNTIVLLGRSAGAHLALMAAYRRGPITARAVVSFYGPTDLVDAYEHPPDPDPLHVRSVEEAFIGGTLAEKPEDYRDASPLAFVSASAPPTLLIQGRRDHIVEARYGQRLRDRLAKEGVPVAYLEIPWAEHAFDAVFNGPSSQLSLYYIERFLTWAKLAGASALPQRQSDR